MKKIIPISIIAICMLIICFYKLKPDIPQISEFQEIELNNEKVLNCNRDIPEGYYDIEVLEGPVSVGIDVMNPGEVYHNYHIRKNADFFLTEGEGKVKITEAKKKIFKGESFEICQMGNYEIGKDIGEGEYNIILQSEIEPNNQIGFYLWNSDESQCVQSYSFKTIDDEILLKVEKNEILCIYRTAELHDKKSEIKLKFIRRQ